MLKTLKMGLCEEQFWNREAAKFGDPLFISATVKSGEFEGDSQLSYGEYNISKT